METKDMTDHLFITINEAAKQVGVVPATIRNWEKAGLFTARRTANGYRVYTLQDIDFLKKIKYKSIEENIGINGIRMLCQQETDGGVLSRAPEGGKGSDEIVSRHFLGSKWKESRISHGYSLEEVATGIGISSSYLYKIESAQANPSYEVLLKLAKFYGENILFYMSGPVDQSNVVKKNGSEPFGIGIDGLSVESLIARSGSTLSALIYTAQAGSEHTEFSSHKGEEFIYVLSGKVEFTLNDIRYMLSPGDSISFDSTQKHRWRNISSKEAKFLWVYTPVQKL